MGSPFRVGPTAQARRDLATQLERALAAGLRDHVLILLGLVNRIAVASIEFEDLNLVGEASQLAEHYLVIAPTEAEHTFLVEDRAWRYLVDLVDLRMQSIFREEPPDSDRAAWAEDAVATVYSSLAMQEKRLFERGSHEARETLDGRFRKLLELWGPQGSEYWARRFLERSDGMESEDARRARKIIETHNRAGRLNRLRTSLRLQVLAWIVESARRRSDPTTWATARSMAQEMPPANQLVAATGLALSPDQPLGNWLSSEGPEREVRHIDSQGPALRALAMALLMKRQAFRELPPADWMSPQTINRILTILSELLDIDEVRSFAADPETDVDDVYQHLANLLRDAGDRQQGMEHDELLAAELDHEKVNSFRQGVLQGWREHRAIEALEDFGLQAELLPPDQFGEGRFGFEPRLEPKGLFVTHSSWVGTDTHGEELGRLLARGEVGQLVKCIRETARGVRASGDASNRLTDLLEELSDAGYEPTLIVVPIDWRLWQDLGLADETAVPESLQGQLRGQFRGIPVLDWSEVPDDRIYAVDLNDFAHVEEAWGEDGPISGPEQPRIELTPLTDDDLERLLQEMDEEDVDRRRRIEASLRVDIYRRYRMVIDDADAVRSVWLPPSARFESD